MPAPIRAFELRQIDPKRRRARRYHIAECHSLFGDPSLLVTWGRIGGPTRVRLETFTTKTALDARLSELLARRVAHGYADHPGEAVDSPARTFGPRPDATPTKEIPMRSRGMLFSGTMDAITGTPSSP